MASLFLLFQDTGAARFKPSMIHFFPCYFMAVVASTIGFIVILCAFITAGLHMPRVGFFSWNIKRSAFSCSTNSTSFWRCIGSIFPVVSVSFAFCCTARTGFWCSTSCGAEAVRMWWLCSGRGSRFSSGCGSRFSSGCGSRFSSGWDSGLSSRLSSRRSCRLSSRCGCSFKGRFNGGIVTCFGSYGSCSVIRRIGFSIGRRENCHKC